MSSHKRDDEAKTKGNYFLVEAETGGKPQPQFQNIFFVASWTLTNNPLSVQITNGSQSFEVSKQAQIAISVTEPILFFYYSNNNPQITSLRSDNKPRTQLNTRLLEIDFNDVSNPVVTSATEFQTLVQSWIDAANTFFTPIQSQTIPDNNLMNTSSLYEITGILSLTINGNGKLLIN